MFGIVKPCRHQLPADLRGDWMGHLCGLCLTLRDHHGQAARATTNTDAVVLSVLVEAQRGTVVTAQAAPCPLRGMRPAVVVAPGDLAAVHAATVSLTMAGTKVADHVDDRDGALARVGRPARAVSRRWLAQGADLAALTGFDAAVVEDAVARSNLLEATGASDLATYVRPTEDAAAAVVAHTAVVAGRPGNTEALRTIGRAFGRITYLLDAYEDADDDGRAGRFNALVELHPDADERAHVARRMFRDAHRTIAEAFDTLDLVQPRLARFLLVDQVEQAGHRVLHVHHGAACGHARPSGRTRDAWRDARASLTRSGRTLAEVTLAGLTAAAAAAAIFNPNEGPPSGEPPMGQPPMGQPPMGQPPMGQPPMGQPPMGQPPMGQQQQGQPSNFANNATDAADGAADCCCDGCACCCCDSCDCCDGCDCCDCA